MSKPELIKELKSARDHAVCQLCKLSNQEFEEPAFAVLVDEMKETYRKSIRMVDEQIDGLQSDL